MAGWHCLAMAPGYRGDDVSRAQWRQYRRNGDVDGAHARVRAGRTSWRFFDQLNAMAAVAGLAAVALWELILPRGAFGASAVFGVGGGLLAMIDTVTLITKQVDLSALALLLLIPYAGEIGARLLMPPKRFRGRVRQVLVGTLAALPILLVIAVLFLRHPESLS